MISCRGAVAEDNAMRPLLISKGVSGNILYCQEELLIRIPVPGWSAFCDLALALYPIVFLWSVKFRMRVKIGLCVLMGLGVMFVINSPYSLSAPT